MLPQRRHICTTLHSIVYHQKCTIYCLNSQNLNNNTWKLQAARKFETLTTFCQTTWCHILEDNVIQPYFSTRNSAEANGSCSSSDGLNCGLNLVTKSSINFGTICRRTQRWSCDPPISNDRTCSVPSSIVFVRRISPLELSLVYVRVS